MVHGAQANQTALLKSNPTFAGRSVDHTESRKAGKSDIPDVERLDHFLVAVRPHAHGPVVSRRDELVLLTVRLLTAEQQKQK